MSTPSQTPRRASLTPILVWLAGFTYAIVILGASPGLQPGVDSPYHWAMAERILGGDIVPSVARSLPLTLYRELDVDHNWGFHLALAPFAAFGDAEIGMKVAAACLLATLFLALYLLLSWRRVPWPWAWAALPALFTTLDWRYLMLRGGPLNATLLLLFVGVVFFGRGARRRRLGAVVVSYVAMLCYHGAILLLPMHIAGIAALFALRRDALHPGQWWEPGLTAGGLLGGLLLNPYVDSGATLRFAYYHIGQMGTDALGLYPRAAEFHPFPVSMLSSMPEWSLLPIAVVGAAAWLVFQRARGRAPAADAVVLGAIALVGLVLAARAVRATEYAVPLAVAFVAVATRSTRPTRKQWVGGLLAATVLVALTLHGERTWAVIQRRTPPMDAYAGAAKVLEASKGLVLNVSEADFPYLLSEDRDVRCVQGLSLYFIHPYPALFADVETLRFHPEALPEGVVLRILDRFRERGVTLVAARFGTGMFTFAERHPDILRPVHRTERSMNSIYALDPKALAAHLAAR